MKQSAMKNQRLMNPVWLRIQKIENSKNANRVFMITEALLEFDRYLMQPQPQAPALRTSPAKTAEIKSWLGADAWAVCCAGRRPWGASLAQRTAWAEAMTPSTAVLATSSDTDMGVVLGNYKWREEGGKLEEENGG
jgi:hypothetical protein